MDEHFAESKGTPGSLDPQRVGGKMSRTFGPMHQGKGSEVMLYQNCRNSAAKLAHLRAACSRTAAGSPVIL